MNLQKATFGAGCFWCIEAVFSALKGIEEVKSGFSGGHIKNPAYREVCEGRTGHAEVIHITFDASVISFNQLLTVFWETHNPTTLNQQGADKGTHYRSAIFYHSVEQRSQAEKSKQAVEDSGLYTGIVTEIAEFKAFYPADLTHDEYYENNKMEPYCQFVIKPKMDKFKKRFEELLKNK